MALELYKKKRDFKITAEPAPGKIKKSQGYSFCVQKHAATRLHYDFRLELDGVLLSWAVTKGPSINPADKRLAVHVEDHPLAYGDFEGTIPQGQYGGGTVMLWDRGTWEPVGDPHDGLKKGNLKFNMVGERLKGHYALVRMHHNRDENDKRENWLLIKEKDEIANSGKKAEQFLDKLAFSVKTGRTMEEIAASKKSEVWQSNRAEKKSATKSQPAEKKQTTKSRKKSKYTLSQLEEKYPDVQLATLVTEPPTGDNWIHEIKFDGYRILAIVTNGEVKIKTRNGNDWTSRFPGIVAGLKQLDVSSAVLDAEAVILNQEGITTFQGLQAALGDGGDARRIEAYFFDLLMLNDKDLSGQALIKRKQALRELIEPIDHQSKLHYSDHLEKADLSQACGMGLEGLISKERNAPYRGSRSKSWLKSKCNRRQEFIIVGYTLAKKGIRAIGAMHLAYMRNGVMQYAGKVGTGLNNKTAEQIFKKLSAMQVDEPAVKIPRPAQKDSFWVRPDTLCEVTFSEWTDDGHVRHPSFEGLREDKAATTVKQELPEKTEKVVKAKKPPTVKKPVKKTAKSAKTAKPEKSGEQIEGVTITHPERVLFEEGNITKGQLAEYISAVAPYMLKQLALHPISLLRCPSGTKGDCFFQRNPDQYMRKTVKPFHWKTEKHDHEYLYIENTTGLVFLIQMGVIEIHPWMMDVKKIDYPSQMIFDLDPDEGIDFEVIKMAAMDIRQRLKNLGLESFVKVSGGKGLHVTVPLDRKDKMVDVKAFADAFARAMVRDVPEAYVATMTKSKRVGKIFIDFFRNDYTATAIADYGVRARAGGPVALPIEWSELKNIKAANQFKIPDVLARLKKKAPNMERYTIKQSLPKNPKF